MTTFFLVVKYQKTVVVSVHVWVFHFIPLVYISFVCYYLIAFITTALLYVLESGIAIPPVLIFLLRIAVTTQISSGFM